MAYRHASPEIDGARLREMRKEAGLTVTQLARRLDLSIAYVALIERGGRRTVAPATFNHICQVMGVEREALLRIPEGAV